VFSDVGFVSVWCEGYAGFGFDEGMDVDVGFFVFYYVVSGCVNLSV